MEITFTCKINSDSIDQAKAIAEAFCRLQNLGDNINGYSLTDFAVKSVEPQTNA